MESQDVKSQLKEFGFSDPQIAAALSHSTNKSLEGCVQWLSDHPEAGELEVSGSQKSDIQPENPAPEGTNPGEKKEGELKPEEPQGKSISDMVNKEYAAMLEGMGYSKNVREKALLMSGNSSVENAIAWITEHQEDEDLEEELLVVGEKETVKLSPEEAAQKAKELQQLLRERRKKKDIEEEREREKNRVAGGKAMTEAKRKMDEQEQQRAIEQFMKSKQEDEDYKKKLLEEMERDKIARFGKDYVQKQAHQQNVDEKMNNAIKQMKRVYPIINYPDTVKVCLQTIKTALSKILENPNEPKFQKMNLSNENFNKRVGDVIGGKFILTECAGFKEEEGFLVLKEDRKKDYSKIIEIINKELFNMGG